jgi:hypothetical protein
LLALTSGDADPFNIQLDTRSASEAMTTMDGSVAAVGQQLNATSK